MTVQRPQAPATPTWRAPVLLGLALVLLGGAVLVGLVLWTYPVLWARWLFLAAWVWLVSGLALWGLSFFYALRHPEDGPPTMDGLLRQAVLVGAYAAFLVWLQWARMLDWGLAMLGGVVFLALEGWWQARGGRSS